MALAGRLKSILVGVVIVFAFTAFYLWQSDSHGLWPVPNVLPEELKSDDPTMLYMHNPIPRRDFAAFAKYPAQNLNDPSGYAFATFYCTRQADVRDPFFEATQSIIWRLLWSDFRSDHPVLVLVCPFTTKEQKDILRGQGAIVKETEILKDFVPEEKIPVHRWQDQFTKLNLWKETQYKKIVFMDSDAFPVLNIDDVFDLVPEQRCHVDNLSAEDSETMATQGEAANEFCNYVYGGVDPYGLGEINGGFLVFKPNMLMFEKLLRSASDTDHYDVTRMEQGLLHSELAFSFDGPFPAHNLPRIYNAPPTYYASHRDENRLKEDGAIRVVHNKLWNPLVLNDRPELSVMWDLDWMKMCRLYDSEIFPAARKAGYMKSPLDMVPEGMNDAKAPAR